MEKLSWKDRLRQKRTSLLIVVVVAVSCLVNLALLPQLIYASARQDDSQPISQGRPAIASSTLSVTYSPQAAVDGDPKTRWISAAGSLQWLAVDFGTSATFQRVEMQWDAFYARSYFLQASDDGSHWTVIYTQNNGQGKTETANVTGKGRYIRLALIRGIARNWFSLGEFQVYGQEGTATPTATGTPSPTPTTTATPTPTPSPTPTPPSSGDTPQLVQQLFQQINSDRAAQGLQPYTWDDKIAAVSTAHSKAITDAGNGCAEDPHQCPGEPAIGDRLKNAGINWSACAENVGGTSPTPDQWTAVKTNIEQGMLNEQPPKDGHRLHLLSTTYHRMGIGMYIANDGFIWMTEDFAN